VKSSTFTRSAGRPFRLQLEALEDRTVPAMINLATEGMSASVNGMVLQQADAAPNSSSDEFLRLQSAAGVRQGYNSSAAPQYDEVDQFTKRVRMVDLPPVTANGMQYRVVKLNIADNQALQSLDELRLYLSTSNLSGYNPTTKQLDGVSPSFDLGDNYVKLDSTLSAGRADMLLYIPAPQQRRGVLGGLLGGLLDNTYLYVYSRFGVNITNPGGTESWGPATGVVPPPSPPPAGNGSLSGFIFRDVNENGINDDVNCGIREVTVALTGTTDDGDVVELMVETDTNGYYQFTGLKPGMYEIAEIQPNGYTSGQNTIGTVDGVQTGQHDDENGDRFFEIYLATSKHGVNYNFAELEPDVPS
jgi:hypothetical protein